MKRVVLLLICLLSAVMGLHCTYSYVSSLDNEMQCITSGCSAIASSEYSRIFGISLYALGAGLFAANFYFAWRSLRPVSREPNPWYLLIINTGAFCFVPYLLYIMLVVLGESCLNCILTHAAIGLLLILSIVYFRVNREARGQRIVSLDAFIFLTICIVFPALVSLLGDNNKPLTESAGDDPIVAHIGNKTYRMSAVDKAIKLRLFKEKIKFRNEYLEERLLHRDAMSKGLPIHEYMEQHVFKDHNITQLEIDAFIKNNADSVPPHLDEENKQEWAVRQLSDEKSRLAYADHIEGLKDKYKFQYRPPASERFILPENIGKGPKLGSEDAIVNLVVYSDFLCYYCSKIHHSTLEMMKKYPGKIRYCHKFYLNKANEREVRLSALAASAYAQNRFWEVADYMYEHQNDIHDLNVFMNGIIRKFNLDEKITQADVRSGLTIELIQNDIKEAQNLGIQASPTIFLNGRLIRVNSESSFTRQIEREIKEFASHE